VYAVRFLNYLVFDCGMSVVLIKNDDDDDDDLTRFTDEDVPKCTI